MRRRFCLAVLLLGCMPAKPPAPKPSNDKTHEIQEWSLSAQNDRGLTWKMSAAEARQQGKRWNLSHVQWKALPRGPAIRCPQAQEIRSQRFSLAQVEISDAGVQATTPLAELRLDTHLLLGTQLQLQAPGWHLKAETFTATLPLKHWSLQRVHARFAR